MSKLNPTKNSGASVMEDDRLAGGLGARAAKQTNINTLKRLVLANLLWENNAYADGESVAESIRVIIPKCDPRDVASLAIASRVEQKLRHIPLFLAVQMLKYDGHKKYVPEVLQKVVTRPDMITDFVAIYEKENGHIKPLAKAAKKGLAMCFNNFSEYEFAKYDRDAPIKLRDVLFLVKAKPLQGKEDLFKKIADRTLTVPDTWEVALSAGKDKRETWTRLITEGKLGALAFLRNLRNMKDALVDSNVIRKGLRNLKSQMLLPLNFVAAVDHAPEFKSDIQDLMLRVYSSLPKLPGYTIFVVDVSGSMNSVISSRSGYDRQKVASVMAMLAQLTCENVSIYCTSGSDSGRTHKTVKIDYPSSGFELIDQIDQYTYRGKKSLGGGGIFTKQCLEYLKSKETVRPDRIIVFSDSQDCDYYYDRKALPAPFGVNNYIVDVSAHKNGVNYKGRWTAEISGWSEHFLTYIAALEGLVNKFDDID